MTGTFLAFLTGALLALIARHRRREPKTLHWGKPIKWDEDEQWGRR